MWPRTARCPSAACSSRRRSSPTPPVDAGRPRGDLRPGAHDADLPHPGGGDRQGEQHAVRAVGGRVDRQGLTRDGDGLRPQAGVVWNNTFNRFDPTAAFGGYGESGFGREGGPAGLAAYLDTDDEGVLVVKRLTVTKTYKLYVGGAFVRSESGRTYRVRDHKGSADGQRGAGVAQGRPGRGGGRAQGARHWPRRPRRTSAARCCTGSPRCSRPAPPSSCDLLVRSTGATVAEGDATRSTCRSTGSCTSPAGPTS